jgi:UDP-galactopyranose mutase
MKKYDFLIVGAGFFGSTFARIATDNGKKCLVIDKKPHLAGAAHDSVINNQIVSSYGAHIFHTHSEEIWNFVNKYCTMETFVNKPKVLSNNKVFSFPLNMMTFHQLWGVVTPNEALQKLKEVRIKCDNPRNFEEWALDKIGKELYELFIYGYTKKQWLKEPSLLPSSIIQRLPIRLTYEENYFTTKYQSVPKEGYTKLVENMLDGIDVKLEEDFFKLDWEKIAKHLVYSGEVDSFFKHKYGNLEYNTMKFEHKTFKGDYQGNAVFNHVDLNVPYLRSIEYKHFKNSYLKHYNIDEKDDDTIVSFDLPISFEENPEPFYPIRDEKNSNLYSEYFNLKKMLPNVTFGGRLGEYKYLDIDQTIASAMQKSKNLLGIK